MLHRARPRFMKITGDMSPWSCMVAMISFHEKLSNEAESVMRGAGWVNNCILQNNLRAPSRFVRHPELLSICRSNLASSWCCIHNTNVCCQLFWEYLHIFCLFKKKKTWSRTSFVKLDHTHIAPEIGDRNRWVVRGWVGRFWTFSSQIDKQQHFRALQSSLVSR